MQLKTYISKEKFTRLAGEYQAKTGLPLILVDPEGKIVRNGRKCAFCRRYVSGGKTQLLLACRETLAKAVRESHRWGEGYITTCPLGLILFAVPIVFHKKLIGGFLSGFAIFPEMRKDFREEVQENLKRLSGSSRALQVNRFDVKSFSLKKVKGYVTDLLALTGSAQINDLSFLKKRNEQYVQQYKIANFLEDLKRDNPDISRKILDKQDEIIRKVKLGDSSGAREILNEFLGSIFFESGMNFDVIKVRIIELIVMISRAAIEAGAGAEELLGLNYSYLTELNKVTDLEELLDQVKSILENFMDKVATIKDKKRSVRLQKMRDYINRNFTRKISARDVAREAELSVGRALHLFREGTGLSLTSYINKMKIEYARYLLLNTEIALADLADELGYFDQSHFTKNFKRLEKITPSHFRLKFKTEL